MKLLPVILACAACGLASADETADTDEEEFHDVQIRLVTFEQIDVTAEKTPDESAEPVSAEIDSILRDAEVLESDDSGE